MFEWVSIESISGGVLIGSVSVLLMLVLGRVAGVSGIVSGLLPPTDWPQLAWRAAFVVGLVVAPFVYREFVGSVPEIGVPTTTPWLVVGGLCVGFGTVLGSGCTSGHGVCGLARLSARSLVAVTVFMSVAGLTVFFIRHALPGAWS